jgi:hypothetical protein
VIIRNRKNLSEQIQIIIDYETRKIGVVHNRGMEMIVIRSVLSNDVAVSYIETETEKGPIPTKDPFDPARIKVGNGIQDCTFTTDKP